MGSGCAITESETLSDTCPCELKQVRVKFALVVGETVSEPKVDLVPDQPPEAVQKSALVDVQLKTAELPCCITPGFTVKSTVGNGKLCTVTATLSEACAPAELEQVRV